MKTIKIKELSLHIRVSERMVVTDYNGNVLTSTNRLENVQYIPNKEDMLDILSIAGIDAKHVTINKKKTSKNGVVTELDIKKFKNEVAKTIRKIITEPIDVKVLVEETDDVLAVHKMTNIIDDGLFEKQIDIIYVENIEEIEDDIIETTFEVVER